MGIDQIGKKGPPLPPPKDAVGAAGRTETARAFDASAVRATPTAPPSEALEPTRTALERLRAGEVDLDGYLDLKVSEATAHLAAMPALQLEALRDALRDRMASDPMLVDLVRTATGRAPEPPGDP
jgi:hypothetical protein